ncbi:hypothetical protein ACEWY4_024829 [Coilia grayii]|uniref:Ependymin n=1 Tax=Coilia grayii TaxID=363190 RepID=A0ABD1IVU5_9TELE
MQAVFWTTAGLLCLAPGLSSAQRPRPCRSPLLYTGSFTVGTQNENLWAVGNYAYDAVNQRIYLGEVGRYNNNSLIYNVLFLFEEGVVYVINPQNQTCVKMALQSDFHPMEVPKDADFVSQVVLGSNSSPGQGLLVNNWRGDIPFVTDHYLVSFTELGCFPVLMLIQMKDFSYPNEEWVSLSYYDNILGADPNCFIPPPFCEDATLVENEDGKVTNFFSVFH